MIDVANELRVLTYTCFGPPLLAGSSLITFHLQALRDDHGRDIRTEFKKKDRISAELVSPGFINPVPVDVLPGMVFDKSSSNLVKDKGSQSVVLNTFMELEPHALHHLIHEENSPAMYSVGPVLSLIAFLCFGSMGSFGEGQLKEICLALERTGFRFLWCLRHSLPNDRPAFPSNFVDPKLVLPEGFLDRTEEIGKIISWAPQVAILSHPAVRGFVSHYGWNSLLESLWFGVPVATWPLFSEQQLNAFVMVKKLGLAVEMKMDYNWGFDSEIDGNQEAVLVSAQEIEVGIRRVMEGESDIRKRVRDVKEKSRMAVMEGGSSHFSLGCFIGNVFDNLQ
ncbi:UDP-glucuronosyl/UDP-glucosyltransferase [Parasponia andersonii]|uniref:UDP-glucuronosyl/UDP-glucosyltransferase n=1 Tax=Parasponia andersonii TaxID=3476 RepID=A0A2P5AQE0_PARAD|nr:UDP-glucuronosyl/UDP-glucosyltransferase [Parasponia andersonii]